MFAVIQKMDKLDATISAVYFLTFIYSSTCFGRSQAHHQELNKYSSSVWFYLGSVVVAVLLIVVGPSGPAHDPQHRYHHVPTVKPEAPTAVVELLMMGMRMPETR
jgi:NADH:ubiquinone oxidoreductase subunit 4 (subunit M)